MSLVAEQLLRLLHHCGMPATDVDFMVGPGLTMNEIVNRAAPRSMLFTGSQRVAEKLAVDTRGKVGGKQGLGVRGLGQLGVRQSVGLARHAWQGWFSPWGGSVWVRSTAST